MIPLLCLFFPFFKLKHYLYLYLNELIRRTALLNSKLKSDMYLCLLFMEWRFYVSSILGTMVVEDVFRLKDLFRFTGNCSIVHDLVEPHGSTVLVEIMAMIGSH